MGAMEIRFKSDRFKFTGELREDANAGNQFYGEDVAAWFCEVLPQFNLAYLDEDWGWYVHTKDAVDILHTLAINVDPDVEPSEGVGGWLVIAETKVKKKALGLIGVWKVSELDAGFRHALLDALKSIGATDIKTA